MAPPDCTDLILSWSDSGATDKLRCGCAGLIFCKVCCSDYCVCIVASIGLAQAWKSFAWRTCLGHSNPLCSEKSFQFVLLLQGSVLESLNSALCVQAEVLLPEPESLNQPTCLFLDLNLQFHLFAWPCPETDVCPLGIAMLAHWVRIIVKDDCSDERPNLF